MKLESPHYEMSDYISSDDGDHCELEIKPPQAKAYKRSYSRHSASVKQSHTTSRRYVCVDSPTEQDLRERLTRRKRYHNREYDRTDEEERVHEEHHRGNVEEHPSSGKRRRLHRDERSETRKPEERHVERVSDDSAGRTYPKNIVIDVEMSPPVLREDESSKHKPREENEYEYEGQGNCDEAAEKEKSDSENSSCSSSKESNNCVDSHNAIEGNSLPLYFPAIRGCRSVEEFQRLNRIEEGAYGVVYRVREKRTNRIMALKRLKMEREKDGFPITSLREINTLLKAQHPNVVSVNEIVVGSNMDEIYLVMEYVEHDLKSLMDTMKSKNECFSSSEVKRLMSQLLEAVNHLHDNWILHRDLKTSNLLLGHDGILKLGDFGLAREYGSPLNPYTPLVVTLWYRAPELLLGAGKYSTSVDIWSVGCIFAELLCMKPLFPGKTELEQLKLIFKALGTPNERIWPEYPKLPLVLKTNLPKYPPHGIRPKFAPNILSDVGYDMLTSLLCYDPAERITADAAILHDYFSEHPLPIDPTIFSTWLSKDKDERGRKATADSPKPLPCGQNHKESREADGNLPVGFNAESTFVLKF